VLEIIYDRGVVRKDGNRMDGKEIKTFPFHYRLDKESEDALTKAVRKGAMGEARDVLRHLSYPSQPGRLSNEDIKNIQNTIMILTAFLYYLSVQEGVDRGVACNVTEQYLKKVQEIKKYDAAKYLINTIILDYTRMVSEAFRVKGTSNTVNEVIRYVDEHVCENYRTETIAQKLGKSVPNTCRLFKSQTGITITMYMQRKKVEKAAELLQNTDIPIKDISSQMGFANQQYFDRVFRRVKGMSPREYRQTMENYMFGSTVGNVFIDPPMTSISG
jgi:AraC family transcriptional regulator